MIAKKNCSLERVWKGCVYPRARPEAPRMREHATLVNERKYGRMSFLSHPPSQSSSIKSSSCFVER